MTSPKKSRSCSFTFGWTEENQKIIWRKNLEGMFICIFESQTCIRYFSKAILSFLKPIHKICTRLKTISLFYWRLKTNKKCSTAYIYWSVNVLKHASHRLYCTLTCAFLFLLSYFDFLSIRKKNINFLNQTPA